MKNWLTVTHVMYTLLHTTRLIDLCFSGGSLTNPHWLLVSAAIIIATFEDLRLRMINTACLILLGLLSVLAILTN